MKSVLKNWLLAIRPKTLPAAVAPVLLGWALAYGDGIQDFPTVLVCLWTAVALQIGTNLANDYFDYEKGADTHERVGPLRVTQAGLIAPRRVLAGFIFSFICAGFGCWFLFERGGWPIAVLGGLSILSGIFYTAGPRPLGYIGLGEVFVLIFFGPVAVAGTYYVQSFEMNYAIILAGLGPGLLSTAILVVNNYRDIETDAKSGKHTLAVRFGRVFAQYEYVVCILAAAFLPVLLYFLIHDHIRILWAATLPFFALPALRTMFSKADGPTLNHLLAFTGKLLLLYSALFAIGWIL